MKDRNKIKQQAKQRRQRRVRARISGTKDRPRLRATKSLKYVYLQLIDDEAGRTIIGLHSKKLKVKGIRSEMAFRAGEELAKQAVKQGIKRCVFDRGGHLYHGVVAKAAEGARAGGLEF